MTSPVRHISSLDIKAIYEALVPKMVEHFNKDGELQPTLLTISMQAPEGEIADIEAIAPPLLAMLQRDDRGKDVMMAIVAALLHEESPVRQMLLRADFPRPDVLAHLCEGWGVRGAVAEKLTPDVAIADVPERELVLLLNLHTAFGTSTFLIPVDQATKQAHYVEFRDENAVHFSGRMQVAEWLAPLKSGPVH
jgi:hypothetical protein